MKKSTIKHLFFTGLVSVLLLAAAGLLFRVWLQSGTVRHRVACLYSNASAYALDYETVVQQLNEAGMDAAAYQTQDLADQAGTCLAGGASVLVVGLDAVPADTSLLEAAARYSADVFLVGTYPGDDYMASYDKVYYVGSRPEYAGELAGQDAALAYRGGAIPDLTGNLLLDYLSAGMEDGNAAVTLAYAVQECEHYGVYSQSCLPQYTAEAEAEEEAEEAADSDAALAEPFTPPEGMSEGAAALAQAWLTRVYEPELIYCAGLDALVSAQEYADFAGWSTRENPVSYVLFTDSLGEAQQGVSRGCATVIYYDAEAVGKCIVQMCINLAQQNYIAEDTGFAPDEHSSLWVPYAMLRSAAANLPEATAVPADSDPEADSASGAESAAQSASAADSTAG